MKLIEVNLAKYAPEILSTLLIKLAHGLSSVNFKTKVIIFENEGVTKWL